MAQEKKKPAKKGWRELPRGGIIDSSVNQKYETGSWANKNPEIDYNKCVFCKMCFIYCPDNCIIIKDNSKVAVLNERCKGCSICANVCPVKAITMKEKEK